MTRVAFDKMPKFIKGSFYSSLHPKLLGCMAVS